MVSFLIYPLIWGESTLLFIPSSEAFSKSTQMRNWPHIWIYILNSSQVIQLCQPNYLSLNNNNNNSFIIDKFPMMASKLPLRANFQKRKKNDS